MRAAHLLFAAALGAADVTLTVRSGGGGQFTSVQSALDSLQPGVNTTLGLVTLLLYGTFTERVHVYSNFTGGVTLIGTGASPADALITYNLSGSSVGTFGSFTMTVDCDDATLVNVAVANNAGDYNKRVAGQSVALGLNGDRTLLVNSSLWGAQDTLFTGAGRSYAVNTYVNGSCDSVFGYGSSVFDACMLQIYDTLTAHRGNGTTAYLFVNSTVTPGAGTNTTYLGRPWGPLAQTVFVGCSMTGDIWPAGWEDWGHNCTSSPPGSDTWCANVTYAEYGTTGRGADPNARVWWSHQLTPQQAAEWTPTNVLSGWQPLGAGDAWRLRHAPVVWREYAASRAAAYAQEA